MLEYAEAIAFLTQKLGIADPESRFSKDKADLLDEIIVGFQHVMPFHNLFLMALSKDEKKIPTMEENIQSMLNCQGGLCWTLNSSMCMLLKAIGYDVYPVLSSVVLHGISDGDHVITIVQGLKSVGDKYLVEVGIGAPTFKAISLDFESESPIYTDSYLTYKFVKREGKVMRMHKMSKTSYYNYSITEGEWGHMNYFRLEPSAWEHIQSRINKQVYTRLEAFLNNNIFICILRNGRWNTIKSNAYLVEMDGRLRLNESITDDSAASIISRLVPQIDKHVVETAVRAWLDIKSC